ncbi:MAG: hypothetical protein MUF16_08755, partial [Burkholderiaceae bacterium]|nr:hypothetical protein [Burkholderiaceae bacterium]
MTQPVNSFNSTQIARAAAGLYDLQLGQTTMGAALSSVTQLGSVAALVDQVFNADFAALTDEQVAAIVIANLGITEDSGLTADEVAFAEDYVANALAAAPAGQKGSTVLSLVNMFAQMGSDATYGAAATAFNAQITAATGYASTPGTVDIPVNPPPQTTFLSIAQETVAGVDSMRITGNQAIRLDFGNTLHQIRGLDLNGDGTIIANGEENNFAYLEANVQQVADNHSDFEVIDAYARNALNIFDNANNFLAPIYY